MPKMAPPSSGHSRQRGRTMVRATACRQHTARITNRFCYMNPDPARNRCDLPEEVCVGCCIAACHATTGVQRCDRDVGIAAATHCTHCCTSACQTQVCTRLLSDDVVTSSVFLRHAAHSAGASGKAQSTGCQWENCCAGMRTKRPSRPVRMPITHSVATTQHTAELKDRKGRGRPGATPPPSLTAAPAPPQPGAVIVCVCNMCQGMQQTAAYAFGAPLPPAKASKAQQGFADLIRTVRNV